MRLSCLWQWNQVNARLLLLLSCFSHVRLCEPIDGSPPGSPVPGILLQEHWSGLSFPSPIQKSEKWKRNSCVRLIATPWTAAHQAPLSVGFSRQEYWSVLAFPSPGGLPDLGMEPVSCVSCSIDRWILYHCATRESPLCLHYNSNYDSL